MKNVHIEKYKILMKEIKDTNRWKGIPYSWMRISILKMSILTKAICKFKAIPIKIPI